MSVGHVLQEFDVQSTRPSRSDAITHDQAAGLVEAWCRFPVQVTTVEVMRAALATRVRYGISYWDAAVLEAGRALGCSVVLSEDLDEATDYNGIRGEDPFRDAA
jgi:predicted nucleic acid-binding protein